VRSAKRLDQTERLGAVAEAAVELKRSFVGRPDVEAQHGESALACPGFARLHQRPADAPAPRAAALSAAGASPLEPTLETASTQSLKRAILDGGFTLISRLAVEAEIKAGTLRALAVTGVDLTRPLRAVRRRRPALPADATRFWRFLSRMAA
jgi:DNA-binding transcriptional LysR family regulator